MLSFLEATMLPDGESKLYSMSTYGDRITEGLNRPGKSRKGLAKAMGITVQGVGQIVRGLTRSATAKNNVAAAQYLGCDPNWLASGVGVADWADQVTDTDAQVAAEQVMTFEVSMGLRETLIHLGGLLEAADALTRRALAPLLSELALRPEEALSIAEMSAAMIGARTKPAAA